MVGPAVEKVDVVLYGTIPEDTLLHLDALRFGSREPPAAFLQDVRPFPSREPQQTGHPCAERDTDPELGDC
eukprot:578568-Pyramimonas_sp.AAC.1